MTARIVRTLGAAALVFSFGLFPVDGARGALPNIRTNFYIDAAGRRAPLDGGRFLISDAGRNAAGVYLMSDDPDGIGNPGGK
jgi:hypothetical protein